MASPLVNVPQVHSMIGQTLSLEYLEDNGHNFKIDDVNDAIIKFSLYRTKELFYKYIERMANHCVINQNSDGTNDFVEIVSLIHEDNVVKYCDKHSTFMHGDLSVENIIQTDKGMFLIDPIYKEDQWSSYLLDISKMMHSYRKYNRMFEYEVFLNGWLREGLDEYILRLLEVSQWIRVLKYILDPELKEEYEQKTKLLLKEVIKYKK